MSNKINQTMNILHSLAELILEQFIQTEINILDFYRNNLM